ncbi:MFS transporter [Modestobacter caceresii]|uniref:MFS transporter n=1 Tax=Modestobacter caceresii TaxID=1522368 RepID=UPI0012E01990|nr:MFS transporter [Modestobacter caceresii]
MSTRPAYLAFATFGALWGTWGAALPALRDATGVSQGQLGIALLFIGVGALPAMALTGRAIDRFGGRVVAVAMVLLACTGVAVSTLATGPTSLAASLLVLGATSGAADVGANAVAGATEQSTGRPVLTRAHGVFSAAVVASSLMTGGVQVAGLPVAVAFGAVVVVATVAAAPLWAVPPAATAPEQEPAGPTAGRARPTRWVPLVAVGAIGALAFAVENAHQSWGAVFLADQLQVTAGVTSAAPAVFAGVTALTRFTMGALPSLPGGPILTVGAMTAATGSVLLATSSSTLIALAGLALAAAGTAPLFPTLLREVLRGVPDGVRGRATSTVASTAYIGFILGPVLVGSVAAAADLRVALIAVASLAALAALAASPTTRWARLKTTETTETTHR